MIECCLDVANHIIASERFRPPKDYTDMFKVIEEQGIITLGHGNKQRKMTKFRKKAGSFIR